MNIFEEIEKLDLPKNEFVVLGSGILAALGIRKADDIDLLVQPELFEKLKGNDWYYEVIEIEGKPRDMLSKGITQIFKDFWWEDKTLSPDEGIARAQNINGINFISLQTLLEYKKDMKREKDLRDVILIEAYLRAHPEM
ncbi:MAG: zinc ABC transporter substrate-binding protein [bacterium]